MVSRLRKKWSPMVAISIPSIQICPWSSSTILKSAKVIEDFPAPVRPTIPTFCCVSIRKKQFMVFLAKSNSEKKLYE